MLLHILFVDTSPDENPLSDVVASFYKDNEFIVQTTSNEEGLTVVDLPAGKYLVIVSCPTRRGYRVNNPYQIELYEDSKYKIQIELFRYPVSDKAGYCRCSGFLEYPNGREAAYADFTLTPILLPNRLYDVAIYAEPVYVKAAANGYVSVDLIRKGFYQVSYPNLPYWAIVVPDRTWADISRVLFPRIVRIELQPTEITLRQGEMQEIKVFVHYDSGLTLSLVDFEDKSIELRYNSEVVLVRKAYDSLVAEGLRPGSTSLEIDPSSLSGDIYVLPEQRPTVDIATITVVR